MHLVTVQRSANIPVRSSFRPTARPRFAALLGGSPLLRTGMSALRRHGHDRFWLVARDGDTELQPALTAAQADGRFQIGALRRPNLPNRIPILAPQFRFSTFQQAKVTLIVSIDPTHHFD